MDSISVECRSRSYEVIVGSELDDTIFEVVGDRDVLVVTDSEVNSLYGSRIKSILPDADIFVLRSGERSKSENALFDLLEFMLDKGYSRRSRLVAIGGGVVNDLTGFAASIYLRGIDYIQVPTTLLAQVDSSVGGKTSINVAGVKNAIGSFWQPRAVVVDLDFLDTNEEREIISGLGEIVKMACLDGELFDYVENNLQGILDRNKENLQEVLARCIEIKRDIVEDDERDRASIRNKLQLGHTVGQALEMTARFMPKSHGEYVLMGMYFEAEVADKIHRINKDYKVRLQSLVERILGSKPDIFQIEKIVVEGMQDRRNEDDLISMIIPTDVGDVDEVFIDEEQLIELLEEMV